MPLPSHPEPFLDRCAQVLAKEIDLKLEYPVNLVAMPHPSWSRSDENEGLKRPPSALVDNLIGPFMQKCATKRVAVFSRQEDMLLFVRADQIRVFRHEIIGAPGHVASLGPCGWVLGVAADVREG
jgi:hypothetical protein